MAFAAMSRSCMQPNAHGPRCSRMTRCTPLVSSGEFHICRLGRQHLASIAIGLSIIILLLVIFAYHGGYGFGSWFYSLMVVVAGLAFVVFGPLLLCRFLVNAYYHQLGMRLARTMPEATQSQDGVVSTDQPQLYACIIIAPENNGTGILHTGSCVFDLPTYEEAVAQNGGEPRNVAAGNASTGDAADSGLVSNQKVSDQDEKLDTPPPSYPEALSLMNTAAGNSSGGVSVDAGTVAVADGSNLPGNGEGGSSALPPSSKVVQCMEDGGSFNSPTSIAVKAKDEPAKNPEA